MGTSSGSPTAPPASTAASWSRTPWHCTSRSAARATGRSGARSTSTCWPRRQRTSRTCERDLGLVCNHLGLLDRSRAVLEDAARTFRERDDAYLEADTLVLLAEADGDVEHLRRARALSHRFDDYRLEANALVAMAELLAKEGNYADARTCLDQTLALYRTHGSTTGIGRALGKLGELCQRFGHLEDAAEFLAEAVEACRNVGMSLREAARTWDLADVLNDLGRTDAARQHRDAAIELGVRLGAIAPEQVDALRAQNRPPRPASLRSDP